MRQEVRCVRATFAATWTKRKPILLTKSKTSGADQPLYLRFYISI